MRSGTRTGLSSRVAALDLDVRFCGLVAHLAACERKTDALRDTSKAAHAALGQELIGIPHALEQLFELMAIDDRQDMARCASERSGKHACRRGRACS